MNFSSEEKASQHQAEPVQREVVVRYATREEFEAAKELVFDRHQKLFEALAESEKNEK